MYCSKKYVPGAVKVRVKRNNKSKAFYVCCSNEKNNTSLSWYDNNNNYVKFEILYKEEYKEFLYGNLPSFYAKGAKFFKGDTVSCRGWTIKLDSNYAFQKFIHNLETECVLK